VQEVARFSNAAKDVCSDCKAAAASKAMRPPCKVYLMSAERLWPSFAAVSGLWGSMHLRCSACMHRRSLCAACMHCLSLPVFPHLHLAGPGEGLTPPGLPSSCRCHHACAPSCSMHGKQTPPPWRGTGPGYVQLELPQCQTARGLAASARMHHRCSACLHHRVLHACLPCGTCQPCTLKDSALYGCMLPHACAVQLLPAACAARGHINLTLCPAG
jgi:hypothetical protein